jgi:hypothetical protein
LWRFDYFAGVVDFEHARKIARGAHKANGVNASPRNAGVNDCGLKRKAARWPVTAAAPIDRRRAWNQRPTRAQHIPRKAREKRVQPSNIC